MNRLLFLVFMLPLAAWPMGPEFPNDCTLSWTSQQGATGYRLYWGNAPGERTQSADMGAALTARCSGVGMVPTAQYHVVVRAYNAAGTSGDSNEVPFVLLGPPLPPTLTVGP